MNFATFQEWRYDADLPEKFKVHFINGHIWTDYFLEDMIADSQVKAALGVTLGGLIAGERIGVYIPGGVALTNADADLRTTPDAMFLSNRTVESGRVRILAEERPDGGRAEIVGAPDFLVGIVGPGSGAAEENDVSSQDPAELRPKYWAAGVREYWRINARKTPTRFHIFRRGSKGYSESRAVDGWVKSHVLKRSFRLTRSKGGHGFPVYQLEHR